MCSSGAPPPLPAWRRRPTPMHGHRPIAPPFHPAMQALSATKGLRAGLAAQQQRRASRRALAPACAAAPVKEVLEKGSKGFKPEVPAGLNKYSGHITQPKSQGASQAMLYATGLVEEDMNKPQARGGPVWAACGAARQGVGRLPALAGPPAVPACLHQCVEIAGMPNPNATHLPPPPPPPPAAAASRRLPSCPRPALPHTSPCMRVPPSACRWASAACGGRATPATCT